jgi:hypothetical protein
MLEAAKDSLARIEKESEQLKLQLRTELTALQQATDKYTAAMADHFNHVTEIDRLRVHIKDNILFYMQSIWNHEPPDQRFFRVYNKPVAVVNADTRHVVPVREVEKTKYETYRGHSGDKQTYEVELTLGVTEPVTKKLVEVADLDNLLGYKGNYMIFPLKENNIVTYFMMQDYLNLEDIITLRDPDEFGNYTLEEFESYIKCLYENDRNSFKKDEEKFKKIIYERLTSPRLDKEKVIIPTTSLYIEALPGAHPLLEGFKLVHRAVDVKKVQSEVRHAELENIRLGARVLRGRYEDPDIEKKIVIDGNNSVVVSPDD